MRKDDLINQISNHTGVAKVDVISVIENMQVQIKKSVAKGEGVFIRGFGSFIPKKRAAKIGRNVKTGAAVPIPAHNAPAFKPAKEFKDAMKAILPPTATIDNIEPTEKGF